MARPVSPPGRWVMVMYQDVQTMPAMQLQFNRNRGSICALLS